MVTICKECEFTERKVSKDLQTSGMTGVCLNTDAPFTDFVEGYKGCALINDGKCKFFKRGQLMW